MFKRILIIGLVLAGIAAGGSAWWLSQQYQSFLDTPLSLPEEGLAYTFQSGSSLRSLTRDMQQQGVLPKDKLTPYLMRWYARENAQVVRLKAGEYHLPAGLKPAELLALLSTGRSVQHSITLVEGWNFKEMRAAIEAHKVLAQTLVGKSNEALMNAIGQPDQYPEGRFLPDTYHFPRGYTDVDLYKRAYQAMEKVLAEEWKNRAEDLPLKTPYEALTLASIIEKETGAAEERPEIAGVFVRRLNKGMLLQTDPTVIYGMGDKYKGNIRRKDLRRDTPYNTYTRKGLTPTPIAMPGRDAINAALHPADGKTLYFVAKADGSGRHYFSKTLKEHNRAVRKYQLKK